LNCGEPGKAVERFKNLGNHSPGKSRKSNEIAAIGQFIEAWSKKAPLGGKLPILSQIFLGG
jgi:hypothetical protein